MELHKEALEHNNVRGISLGGKSMDMLNYKLDNEKNEMDRTFI